MHYSQNKKVFMFSTQIKTCVIIPVRWNTKILTTQSSLQVMHELKGMHICKIYSTHHALQVIATESLLQMHLDRSFKLDGVSVVGLDGMDSSRILV